jgi:site-specific DNA recombinase
MIGSYTFRRVWTPRPVCVICCAVAITNEAMNTSSLYEGTSGALGVRPAIVEVLPTRYCLYARKSTEQDEVQALSIESQVKEMQELAARDGIEIVETKRESHSAKETGQRPVFNEIVSEIRSGKYDGILTWAPDRISRNAGDLGKIVDLMDAGYLKEIRTCNQKFSNNPNEKFLLMILGSQAKLENDNKRINVKRGLKTRAEMGLLPGVAPVGYLNDKRRDHKCEMIVDPVRSPIVKQMFEKAANDRWSGRKIHAWLKEQNFCTKNNRLLSVSSVYLTLRNPFYCGVYEYPRGTGNWYTGKHDALISRDLWQAVQEKLTEDHKPKTRNHEFTFTKMITCGHCGSGITAQEKSKILKQDGSTKWYTYYSCTKARDKDCPNPYLREDQLIAELCNIIDRVDIDEIGARHLIEKEVARFNKLSSGVLGSKEKQKVSEIDIKRYAKYLLEEGTMEEKRELLAHLQGKLLMRGRKITLD